MDFEDKMHRQQFEEMYNQYQTPLRKLAYRYNVPVDDIEDMVHDTFLSYARSDYSLELPPDEMRKLLSRILKNRCIDFHRSAKRRNCYSIDDDGYYREEIFVNEKEEPLIDGIISKEKCRALMNELEKISGVKIPAPVKDIEKREVLHSASLYCHLRTFSSPL